MTKRLVVCVLFAFAGTVFCETSGPVVSRAERDKVIAGVEVRKGELSEKNPPVVVEKREEYRNENHYGVWIGDNTFRVSAEGMPDPEIKSPDGQRKSARLAAEKSAVKKVIRIIFTIRADLLRKKRGIPDYAVLSITNQKQWLPFVEKEGMVLKEYYDEKQNCRIIYEINCREVKNAGSAKCGGKWSLKSIIYWKNQDY